MYLMCPRCRSYFDMNAESLGKQGRKVRCSVCSKSWKARQGDLNETLPQDEAPDSSSSAAAPQAAPAPPKDAPQAAPAPVSVPPPPDVNNIPPPTPQESVSESVSESVADKLDALTQHHHAFAPLEFTERNLEQPLNNLLRFAFAWSLWGLSLLALLYVIRTYPIEVLHRFPNAIHFYERLNMSHPDFAKLLLKGKDYTMTQVTVTSEYRLARDLLNVRVLVANRTNEEKPTPILRGTFRDARGAETNYFHFQPKQEILPPQGALEYSAQVDLPQATSTTLTLTLLSLFEQKLDLGSGLLKVYNTKPPPAPAANETQNKPEIQP